MRLLPSDKEVLDGADKEALSAELARLISKVYQADPLVCKKAAQVRSRSWRTSPTSCPSAAPWTIWA